MNETKEIQRNVNKTKLCIESTYAVDLRRLRGTLVSGRLAPADEREAKGGELAVVVVYEAQ